MQDKYKQLLLIPIVFIAILLVIVAGPRNDKKEYYVGGSACDGTIHGNFHIMPCSGMSEGYTLVPGPSIKKKVVFLGIVEAITVGIYARELTKKPAHHKQHSHKSAATTKPD
jgi:hypothetical protein